MRVTNNMMTMQLLLNVNRNLAYMSKRQDELATGKKISVPSDDPVLASKVLARRTDLAELEQYAKNTDDALGWMEITEKSIEDNGNVLQRMRELMVQAANGINTAEETQKIAEEIKNLKDQLISNGNATFAGRYIFSGFETNQKLLDENGNFNIDVDQYALNNSPVVKYEVSVGESMNVMTSGLDVYGYVPETNIMTNAFPSGNATGIPSSKEYVSGAFDLNLNYTAQNLDVTIGGVTYNVDESSLNGTVRPLTKEQVVTAYNDAIGTNGIAYFNANNQLVIESSNYGPGVPPMSVAASAYVTTYTAGVAKTEATLSNGTTTFVDPLTADGRDILTKNNLNIVVNGISRKIKPDATLPVGFTVADYIAHMNTKIDTAFGSDIVDFSINGANQFEITTKNTSEGVAAELIVDFPRVHQSQLIADVDELLSYMMSGDNKAIGGMLDTIDDHIGKMLSLRADIGARNNRLDMISKKIASNNISFTKLLSDAEDADMSEVIMLLKNAENVYQASLSTGARVIQPSLVDFLR
ncbi:MAG: flagellar hook-associated protein FlgL [Clostridia bacterium]|nr:flagellar hook-associated protein FlgL [Clostridia bacterium]